MSSPSGTAGSRGRGTPRPRTRGAGGAGPGGGTRATAIGPGATSATQRWGVGVLVAAVLVAVAGFALYAYPGPPGSAGFPRLRLPWSADGPRLLLYVGPGYSVREQAWCVALTLVPLLARRTRLALASRAVVGLLLVNWYAGSRYPLHAVSGGLLLVAWLVGLYGRYRTPGGHGTRAGKRGLG